MAGLILARLRTKCLVSESILFKMAQGLAVAWFLLQSNEEFFFFSKGVKSTQTEFEKTAKLWYGT